MTPNRREFNRGLLATVTGGLASAPFGGDASGAAPRAVTAVDTHCHVFRHDLPMVPERRYTPDYDATPEKYLAELDRHQMSHGLLIQPSFLGTDNSYLLATLKAQPDRLRGVAVIDPDRDLDKLEGFNLAGVVGVRLNLASAPVPSYTAAQWKKLAPRVKELDWHVELYAEANRLQSVLDPLMEHGVNVVVDHFGRPAPALGVDDPGFRYLLTLGATRRVWVKISGVYRNGEGATGEDMALKAVPLLRSAYGLDRLLWGSDWPHTQFEKTETYDRAYAFLSRMLPEAADRHVVLTTAPVAVFHFGKRL